MKYIILITSLTFAFSTVAMSQDNSNWFTSKDKAMAYAQDNSQKIMMVFSGSDWCKPCKQFKKDILTSEEFKRYALENLTILYLDFPARKKNLLSKEATAQNESLAEQFNKSGTFPKIILTDHTLTTIKETVFKNQSVSDFIATIGS